MFKKVYTIEAQKFENLLEDFQEELHFLKNTTEFENEDLNDDMSLQRIIQSAYENI